MLFAPLMQPREVRTLPKGEDWIYEFYWGGERVRAVKLDEGVHLLSREGRDLTNRFPRIAASLTRLRTSNTVIDGEVLYLDTYPEPVVRFLAEGTDEFSGSSIALLVYDLLCDEGTDVRSYSLLCRRLLLASIVQGTSIILSPLLEGYSIAALDASARLGFRGIVAKRAGSTYRPSSSIADWMKLTFPVALAMVNRRLQRSSVLSNLPSRSSGPGKPPGIHDVTRPPTFRQRENVTANRRGLDRDLG